MNPGPIVSARRVEVAVVPVASPCGGSARLRGTLQNKTLQPWSGVVSFVSAGTVNTPVTLAASGAAASKTVDVKGGPLDCTKALGVQGVRVWKEPSAPIFTKALSPKRVSAVRDLSASAPNGSPRPWLRRVVVDGTCGQPIAPSVILHSFGPGIQPANVKLTFGATTKTTAVQLSPNQALPVPLEVAAPLDCQAAGGIPAFEYALLDGVATSGSLSPAEVTFE